MRQVAAFVLAGIALAGAGCGASKSAAVSSPAAVYFTTVTAAQLAKGGIRLAESPNPSTPAGGRRAAAAASRWFGGLKVLQSSFAHCVDGPAINEDCWAVSLDTAHFHPPGGTPPQGPVAKPPTYLVVLVKPGSNRILDAQAN